MNDGVGAAAEIPVVALLFGFLIYHVVQRLCELYFSQRNVRALRARGAREYGQGHYPWIVVMHVLFPIALIAEVLVLGALPGAFAPLWLGLWLLAQGMRWSAMQALGERWTTRVLVIPGAPLVQTGLYRYIRHPNYVAVVIELFAAPMMFGAWRTAVLFTVANAIALSVRIRCEQRALAGAEA
jgi:methyltransferase